MIVKFKIFDTYIKNGYVLDPELGLARKANVGISEPNIAEIVELDCKERVDYRAGIDAEGLYVVPGLVDFHSHVFSGGIEIGMDPSWLLKQGVVATVDAGSIGYPSFNFYRKTIMADSIVHVNVALNASRIGLLVLDNSEFAREGYINEEKLIETIKIHKDVIIGIKMRYDKESVIGDGIDVLLKAKAVARAAGVPLLVHVTDAPLPLPEYIKYFDKGDIVVHMYHGKGNTLLNENDEVWPEAWEARKRGVLFDCTRGTLHINYKVAGKAIEQGFIPDIIGSDMSCFSESRPLSCQLSTIMSELLNLGMSFEDILTRCTHVPARLMKGVSCGIDVGLPANLALLKIESGPVEFTDSQGNKMQGDKKIVPQMTILNGKVVYKA